MSKRRFLNEMNNATDSTSMVVIVKRYFWNLKQKDRSTRLFDNLDWMIDRRLAGARVSTADFWGAAL